MAEGGRERKRKRVKKGSFTQEYERRRQPKRKETRGRASIWCIFEIHLILINVVCCSYGATTCHIFHRVELIPVSNFATSHNCAIHLAEADIRFSYETFCSLSLSVSHQATAKHIQRKSEHIAYRITRKWYSMLRVWLAFVRPNDLALYLLCGESNNSISRIAKICINKHKVSIN